MDGATLQGWAALILSASTAVSTLVLLYRGRERGKKLDQIAAAVDGLSDKRAEATHALGVREGAEAERANPTEPK